MSEPSSKPVTRGADGATILDTHAEDRSAAAPRCLVLDRASGSACAAPGGWLATSIRSDFVKAVGGIVILVITTS